jgi:hypothetical protein
MAASYCTHHKKRPQAASLMAFARWGCFTRLRICKASKAKRLAWRDERACLFAGKVFTLPLDLQMHSGQPFPCLVIVVGLLPWQRRDIAVDHRLDSWLGSWLDYPLAPLVPASRLPGPGVGMPMLMRLNWLFHNKLPFGVLVGLA